MLRAVEPVGPGVRVDAGITTGDEVTVHYDPMIAKLIVLGEDRADAIRKMDWALSHYVLLGVTTNIPFLRDLITHEVFRRGEATTDFVDTATLPAGSRLPPIRLTSCLWPRPCPSCWRARPSARRRWQSAPRPGRSV